MNNLKYVIEIKLIIILHFIFSLFTFYILFLHTRFSFFLSQLQLGMFFSRLIDKFFSGARNAAKEKPLTGTLDVSKMSHDSPPLSISRLLFTRIQVFCANINQKRRPHQISIHFSFSESQIASALRRKGHLEIKNKNKSPMTTWQGLFFICFFVFISLIRFLNFVTLINKIRLIIRILRTV